MTVRRVFIMSTGNLGTHPGTSMNHNRFLGRWIGRVGSRLWTPECLDIHPVVFLPVGIRGRCGVWTTNSTTRWHCTVASWVLQTVYSSSQVSRGTHSTYGLATMCTEAKDGSWNGFCKFRNKNICRCLLTYASLTFG